MSKKVLFLVMTTLAGLTSCNSNDDVVDDGISIPGITITDDVDCCSAEEALQVYKFLQTVKIIPQLSTVVNGSYNVFAYSSTGSFHTGYNDIYFVATKKSSGNYIKNFDIKSLNPLMYMSQMDMRHSTPASSGVESFNDNYLAVKRGWVSFLMSSTETDSWTVAYDAEVLGSTGHLADTGITVAALPDGQEWVKSVKVDGETYILSLVKPDTWATGTNEIRAYISVKSNPVTSPYALSSKAFSIDIDPRMPDMGNHTSPDNVALTRQSDGSYAGVVNLTMTGLWRIHLTLKDANGNTVAGGDDLSDGYSSLYWDVTI